MDLVFATNNSFKLEEVRKIVGEVCREGDFRILSLEEKGIDTFLPETSHTLAGNAAQKSFYIFQHYGFDCFADDTGLEVQALQGRPGVYSARYAGEDCSFDDNMNKLLTELKGKKNRKARFRTIISLIIGGQERRFEGFVNGIIIDEKRGKGGFGYDPVFMPDGYDKTFGELEPAEKNRISHRSIAVRKLAEFLSTQLVLKEF